MLNKKNAVRAALGLLILMLAACHSAEAQRPDPASGMPQPAYTGFTTYVHSEDIVSRTVASATTVSVECDDGDYATGGGYEYYTTGAVQAHGISGSLPLNHNAWSVQYEYTQGAESSRLHIDVYVVCAEQDQ